MQKHNAPPRNQRAMWHPPLASGPLYKVICDEFTPWLHDRGFAPSIVSRHQWRMLRIARWLSRHPRRPGPGEVTCDQVPEIIAAMLCGYSPLTAVHFRESLYHWLRFQGRFTKVRPAGSDVWVTEYVDFLITHRGVGPASVEHATRIVRSFLRWKFGCDEAVWARVSVEDIWAFAKHRTKGLHRVYANGCLWYLRRFLQFVHLRGACSPKLASAVPRIATAGHRQRGGPPLSPDQCASLLDAFRRDRPVGRRDYAMTVCMLELGLRGVEVVSIRLPDIDWKNAVLNVPPTKTGRGRQMPISPKALAALQAYIDNGRPVGGQHNHVFVRHPRRVGLPLSCSAVKHIVRRACVRGGFEGPRKGMHRLRHTFATRLHRSGMPIKPLADLLGHIHLDSPGHYIHTDCEVLRPLVQPWPLSA